MKGKIFNAQEVQGIISGNKTQFREVIKVQPQNDKQQFGTIACSSNSRDKGKHQFINPDDTKDRTELFKCPYQVGQKILARVARAYLHFATPQIKEIRVERLQSIGIEDAIAEGFKQDENLEYSYNMKPFADNWNAMHKKPEEKFEANPWVWSISFGVLHAR